MCSGAPSRDERNYSARWRNRIRFIEMATRVGCVGWHERRVNILLLTFEWIGRVFFGGGAPIPVARSSSLPVGIGFLASPFVLRLRVLFGWLTGASASPLPSPLLLVPLSCVFKFTQLERRDHPHSPFPRSTLTAAVCQFFVLFCDRAKASQVGPHARGLGI